jgi:hypothetical protein
VAAVAVGLGDPDNRDLVDSVLWFGTDYGPGDPLRWSPVNVELLLLDWFPRKIVADPGYLSRLPTLLRAFIRFSHGERGVRQALTDETVGHVRLLGLDDELLPDEAFEWAGIAEDIHPVVQEVLDACDRVADEVLDVEHRTAMRRFLSRGAVGDPAIFRRKVSPIRGAAAVAWVIARANDTVGAHGSTLSVADLLAAFGVTGSVSQRAEPLLRANGVDPQQLLGRMRLGTPDLLVSRKRASIIEQRDQYLAQEE